MNEKLINNKVDVGLSLSLSLSVRAPHNFQHVKFQYQTQVWKNGGREPASGTVIGSGPYTKPLWQKLPHELLDFPYAYQYHSSNSITHSLSMHKRFRLEIKTLPSCTFILP